MSTRCARLKPDTSRGEMDSYVIVAIDSWQRIVQSMLLCPTGRCSRQRLEESSIKTEAVLFYVEFYVGAVRFKFTTTYILLLKFISVIIFELIHEVYYITCILSARQSQLLYDVLLHLVNSWNFSILFSMERSLNRLVKSCIKFNALETTAIVIFEGNGVSTRR